MSPVEPVQKRRRVLIELRPPWEDRMRLWLHKLQHPRTRWFAGDWIYRRKLNRLHESQKRS